MDAARINEILEQTFSDSHFSRAEKQAFAQILSEIGEDRRTYGVFANRAFEMAAEAMPSNRERAVVNWLEGVIKVLMGRTQLPRVGGSTTYFSPGSNCRNKIIDLLRNAKKTADICVFTITDNSISREITRSADRGVAVRIISDDEKSEDLGSDIEALARHGIPVRTDNAQSHMHHKFALFDSVELLTGSYNWTRSAADFNEENLIAIRDGNAIRSFQDEFNRLWEKMVPYR